uniref:Zinc finger, GRF-type n=1 Tax=Lactuca sativa TaxID=4236 RepID=A0A9R1XTQ0_LACSA|nr:hypothetical protein LSAT_V11C200063990 [Lactuca sativa]
MFLWPQFCVAHVMDSTQFRSSPLLMPCIGKDSKFRFLGWFDPPMCDRAKAIIPSLLKSMNNLKLSVKELEDEIRNLRFYLKMAVKEIEDEVCKLKLYLW